MKILLNFFYKIRYKLYSSNVFLMKKPKNTSYSVKN